MARLHEQTWHRRSWTTFRSYVQLDLGRRPATPDDTVPLTLDDARYLIAREHGFDSWQALVAFVTVVGYRLTLAHTPGTATRYLYVLCAEVIVGAAYLFHTYWIAMRNMMYANR